MYVLALVWGNPSPFMYIYHLSIFSRSFRRHETVVKWKGRKRNRRDCLFQWFYEKNQFLHIQNVQKKREAMEYCGDVTQFLFLRWCTCVHFSPNWKEMSSPTERYMNFLNAITVISFATKATGINDGNDWKHPVTGQHVLV